MDRHTKIFDCSEFPPTIDGIKFCGVTVGCHIIFNAVFPPDSLLFCLLSHSRMTLNACTNICV